MNLAALLIPPSLDAKQALRLRRFGLAALSYALVAALVALAWTFGMLPASAALEAAAAFLALNLGLYLVIRSGFNLRFEDPSLTRFQILAVITVVMYTIYHMDDGRNIVLFSCFIVFLFGIFRLNIREFTVVTLYTLAAYAVVINLLMHLRPQAIHDVPGEWMSWVGLGVILPCFIIIGGQVNTLRRKLRESEMRESEMRFRSLTEMSSDFYWESDTEHRLTQRGSANRKLSTVSVFQQGTQVGQRRWEIPYLSPDEAGWQAHRAVLDAHRPFRDFELSRRGTDLTEQHISISGDPVFDESGAFKGYRGVGKNISGRKAAEAKIVRLTQFYAALSQCSQAIVRCAGEEELMQQICRVAVVFGGMKMAWIGFIDPGTRMVRFAARYGDRADEYLQGVQISVDADSPLGRGPTGIAIRENRPFWCQDLPHQPLTAPWHERRARFGWAASASLPLRRGGVAVGVLSLYAGEAGAFDEAVSDLVIEMAADISFALDNFERESRRQRAEEALHESEARFRSLSEMSSDFYWESDAEHRITKRGLAGKQSLMSVFDRSTQVGERRWEIPYLSPDEAGWQAHRAVLDAHLPFRNFELSRLGTDGLEHHVSIGGDPVFDESGAFKGYRGVGKDVTEQVRRIDDLRRLRAAMDATADAIYLVDRTSMRFIYVNDAACRMQGCTREELLALEPDRVLSTSRAELEHVYDSIIAGGAGTEPLERQGQRKDGSRFWIELRRRAQRTSEGWMIVTVVRDITDRKLVQEALRENEARLNLALRSASMGVWHWDIVENKRYFDAQACRLVGIDPARFTGTEEEFLGAVHPDDRETLRAAMARTVGQDVLYEPEYRAVWPDGSVRYITARGRLVRDNKGRPVRINGIIWDITERKRAEGALRESEDRYRDIVENSAGLICTHDLEGKLLSVNAAMVQFTGYSPEALLRMNVADLLTQGARDGFAAYLAEIRTKGTARGLMQIRTEGGKSRWWEYHNTLRTEGVAAPVVRGMGEDVTERKRAEEALKQQHARLLEAERDLLTAHESLAEADRLESVGRLAAGVAHEVKNPLTIIRLGTDYLAKQFSQESNQAVFDKVRGAIDRADNVIGDLLDFSRQKAFAPRPTNISDVIDNAIHLVKHEIDRRNIVIIRNRNDLMPPIYADPDRLVQVFINLLSNAAQAIGQDGSIEVVTRSIRLSERDLERPETSMFRLGEPVVAVDIRDNGPGISAEHENKLFEPFFTTKPVGEGSGLGLAVSRNIVIMHGGSISISNRPEGGASALLMFRVDREHSTNEKANTGSR